MKQLKKRLSDTEIFIRSLKHLPITKQQKKTLRGQALAGDLEGAQKGLAKIKKEYDQRASFHKKCAICGKEFTTKARNQIYCSEKCKNIGHEKNIIASQSAKKAVRKAKRGMQGITTGILDERLAEAKTKGMTCSELQRERTLELIRKGEL